MVMKGQLDARQLFVNSSESSWKQVWDSVESFIAISDTIRRIIRNDSSTTSSGSCKGY